MIKLKLRESFTLIELLVVIVVIAVLATIVFFTLNPVERSVEERNLRRNNDVKNILDAIILYVDEKEGVLPESLFPGMKEAQLGTCSSEGDLLCSLAVSECLNLNIDLAKYIKSMPVDPLKGSTEKTGYSIKVSEDNIIVVSACVTEHGETIKVSK